MRKKLLLIAGALLAALPSLRAQVTTDPTPLQEDSENVTIYFHADEGNKGMMGLPATTEVYAHTGVEVVDNNGVTTSWKYAPSWNEDLPKYRMEYVSENLWKLYIGDIREYYGVAADETVKCLCFVFRTTGTNKLEGKGDGNTDIFVDVLDGGFQLAFRQSRASNLVNADTPAVKFTATTTEDADIKIYIGETLLGEESNVKKLQLSYKFENEGDYDVKAVATKDGRVLEKHILMAYPRQSVELTGSEIPPMGLTKNSNNTYTFCFAAPEKQSIVLVGSWNGYTPSNQYVMDYMVENIEGVPFRYFTITVPASTTGKEFGYYYYVDGTYTVGDPYARLILDPSNDKYISEEVYPDMPAYPDGLPSNTVVTWYKDNLLKYNWTVDKFQGAAKEDLVIYELLFRDFTGTEGKAKGDGTVRQAIDKLGYLKGLGINAIELLPINEFNGNNSWGYNPNFYFAIDKAYGTPQDYKEFIDKCHELGIAVILDVVFNQSDWLHPWYRMYPVGSNPFYNATAPHAYSVLNDWNQGYPLVERQWCDMLQFWMSEYKVDGFRFDLVKGLGDNTSYANNGDSATNAYNASRVARMKRLHEAMREVNPDAYFINENLAGAQEENEMAADGELNWMNVNNSGCQYAMGYSSSAALTNMLASKAGRTAGSTVAYLESHDEQRLAYKQDMWGVDGVKGDNKVSMQRNGSAAAQMILVPGSHMIWMFSEMGNAQNTKDNSGGNNTSPKIVNWALLDDPNNAGLVQSYTELINMRLGYKDLFTTTGNYTMNLSSWSQGRWIRTYTDDKELYAVMNPNVDKEITVSTPFRISNSDAYHVASKSYDSNPSFDAVAQTITVPANCYAVVTTKNVTNVENVVYEEKDGMMVFGGNGEIRVLNNAGAVEVYTLDGVRVARGEGDAVIAVPAGLYLVKAGKNASKVQVR